MDADERRPSADTGRENVGTCICGYPRFVCVHLRFHGRSLHFVHRRLDGPGARPPDDRLHPGRDPRRRVGTARLDWRGAGQVRHGFTHFELEMEVYVADLARRPHTAGKWIAADKLKDAALPTVMRKLIEHAGLLA